MKGQNPLHFRLDRDSAGLAILILDRLEIDRDGDIANLVLTWVVAVLDGTLDVPIYGDFKGSVI